MRANVIRVEVNPNHVGLFCDDGHWQGKWIGHDAIRDGIRYGLLAGDVECSACHRRPATTQEPRYLRAWLRTYHPEVHRRIADHFERVRASGENITFSNWTDFMTPDLRRDVQKRSSEAESTPTT